MHRAGDWPTPAPRSLQFHKWVIWSENKLEARPGTGSVVECAHAALRRRRRRRQQMHRLLCQGAAGCILGECRCTLGQWRAGTDARPCPRSSGDLRKCK